MSKNSVTELYEGNTVEVESPANDGTTRTMSFSSDVGDIDAADIARPKLKLAQGLTPEVGEGKARVGKWFINGQNYDTVTVIPRGYTKDSGVDDKGNAYDAFYYEVYVVEAGCVATMMFKNSTLSAAREINGIALRSGGFGKFAVTLGVKDQKNNKGAWKVPTVEAAAIDAETLERGATALF